jgi:hypothetical protein
MIYFDPPVKRKGKYTAHLIWYSEAENQYYRHFLQDFALGKLDMSPSWEQKKGSHLEHYDLIGKAMIAKALKAGAAQVTAGRFRAMLKKKKSQIWPLESK